MSDLKDCPFCGGKAAYETAIEGPKTHERIVCTGQCNAQTDSYLAPAYAADAWNLRHSVPVVPDPVSEWKDRYIHVAKKLGWVLGLNNQERGWVRECGFPCEDEKT